MRRPRVLLADDHLMFTEGLRNILEPHYDIVGSYEDGNKAVASTQELSPDVVVMDISMPLLNGIKAARQILRLGILSKIIILTMHSDAAFVREAFEAGANGYVLKNDAGTEIVAAIREAMEGRKYISLKIGPIP